MLRGKHGSRRIAAWPGRYVLPLRVPQDLSVTVLTTIDQFVQLERKEMFTKKLLSLPLAFSLLFVTLNSSEAHAKNKGLIIAGAAVAGVGVALLIADAADDTNYLTSTGKALVASTLGAGAVLMVVGATRDDISGGIGTDDWRVAPGSSNTPMRKRGNALATDAPPHFMIGAAPTRNGFVAGARIGW